MFDVIEFACPVALAALGEVVVEQSGVINIGLEGSMLCSAFFAMLTSFLTHNPWLGLGAGILASLVVGGVFGLFTIYLARDQVVIGTAINLLALGLTGSLYRARFGQSGELLSVPKLPVWQGLDPLLGLLIIAVPLLTFLLRRTGWGLAIRAAGEFPPAVQAAGYSVRLLRMQSLMIGALFAGLGGAYLSVVITGGFTENMTAGRGFVAIAMVTFGRWKPIYVFIASLLIGLAGSLQFWLQGEGWKIPYQFFVAFPYLLALAVLVLVGKAVHAPSALAKPYREHSS